MKGILWKLIVLKLIQILILSQVVSAQSLSNENTGFEGRTIDSTSSTSFDTDSRDFEQFETRENFNEFEEANGDSKEVKTQKVRAEERYEFREKTEFMRGPDFGPQYENKEEMLFGRVFGYVEDGINELDIMKHCSEPGKIADIVIDKVKSKIGDVSNVCKEIEEHEAECKERVKEDCSRIGHPDISYARDEREKLEILANSCPANEEKMAEICLLNSKEWIEDKLQYAEEDCDFEWERFGANNPDCKRMDEGQNCDEDAYIDNCIGKYKPFEEKCPEVYPPRSCNGRVEQKYNDKGCIVGYLCIEECPEDFNPVCGNDGITYHNKCKAEKAGVAYTYGECKKCLMTEEEAERKADDCRNNNGNPEKAYKDGCVIEVRCSPVIKQCPMTNEETERLSNECMNKGGNPEKVFDGDCVKEVICHIDTAAINNGATGSVVRATGAFTYEEAKEQCRREWEYQKDNCKQTEERCNKDNFIGQCVKREKENAELNLKNARRQCERDAKLQAKHRERDCSRMEADRQRCLDDGSKRCGMEQGLSGDCRNKLTEENFRNFIIKEAEKKCRFIPFMKEKDFSKYDKMEVVLAVLDTASDEEISKLKDVVENLNKKSESDGKIIFSGMISPNKFNELKRFNFVVDAKLSAPESSDRAKARKEAIVSGLDPKKVVEKLLELRDTDVSSEYKYLIEGEASDILEVSDDLDEISRSEESKGIGYKIKLFLGFAKDVEEGEIKQLKASRQRLEASISSLSKLAEQVPDDIAKSILKAQVEELERQKQDMDDLIKQKDKKAKGLLRLFGLFG